MPMKPKPRPSSAPKTSPRPKSGDDARSQAMLDRAAKGAKREYSDYMDRPTAPKTSPRPKPKPKMK
jgi:hypothetical protein